ncbi:hypothetical protein [Beijerinckia indica]|uniref:MotA/TolQ/ExbB proton channel domain-containing protein n=1 Tax=Beijerinckia indica subsp. indica (strain ATCC 9039 / DSM 1715 / NCIMB 8712) TaxID=395963 RepID=B2IDW9_BEII9|nr:hypothetical protein [Beijerinckia indica]ACB96901.1 conserved hypothetical protein [Beijerinckia indica subsp. indica ATCC 9039]
MTNDLPNPSSLALSSPYTFLLRMLIFLALTGGLAFVLQQQIAHAFMANPGLNGLIGAVLAIGILLGLRQVVRLFREIRFVNAWARGIADLVKPPILLAPMASLLAEQPFGAPIATMTSRTILDSVGTRLDEARDIARYLTGLLIFLGLLGTFWGLLETVGSIGGVIQSMQTGADAAIMFDNLKNGLAAPLAGMSISFTSSLFGLAGSLILGFLDLQAGQAQNRFYTELEDLLMVYTQEVSEMREGMIPVQARDTAPRHVEAPMPGHGEIPAELRLALEKIAAVADQSQARATALAIANLAEGIQGLVLHMRSEHQLLRDWVEAQADESRQTQALLQRMLALHEQGQFFLKERP